MNGLDCILTRRSIRQYTPDPVSDEEVKQMLSAAMAAPSAGNEQPWHFVVIRDRELLDAVPRFHPHAQMLVQAPLAIVVCGDPSLERYKGYWMVDCSAATQNILLAAHALGLGSVWIGVWPVEDRVEEMRALLGIAHGIVPFALIALGRPGEHKGPSSRFDEGRVHKDRW